MVKIKTVRRCNQNSKLLGLASKTRNAELRNCLARVTHLVPKLVPTKLIEMRYSTIEVKLEKVFVKFSRDGININPV